MANAFPLTRKRMLKQPLARQHKLVADWLKELYQEAIDTGFHNPKTLEQIRLSYCNVLKWLEETGVESPDLTDQRGWLEFVSNQFHYHKQRSGIGLSEHNLLPKVTIGDLCSSDPWTPSLQYRVALDNLRSAFNVGSIFRQTDAVGFQSVMIGGKTPGKDHAQVQKTAMGCTNWIPQETCPDLAESLIAFKKKGTPIIGVETVEGSESHFDYQWPDKAIVVMGNEEYGLSKAVLLLCDHFVHIPMLGRKNSINVSNAFAVISSQIVRSVHFE